MEYFQCPERDYIYEIIYNYYNNPKLYKVKNLKDFSMYAIQLPCLLMNEKRFIIALTNLDSNQIGHDENLNNLRWKTFMVRSLNDESLFSLPIHNYSIKRDDIYMIGLKIKSRTKEISVYSTDIGIFLVSLIHCKNQEFEYPNEGNLVSALETFQTILQWE